MVRPLGLVGGWLLSSALLMSNYADCHEAPIPSYGILMFHLWYINISACEK